MINEELGERMVPMIWLGKQYEWRTEIEEELSLFEKLRKDQYVQRGRVRVAEKVSS